MIEDEFSVIAIRAGSQQVILNFTSFLKANGGTVLGPTDGTELPSKAFFSFMKSKPVQLHDNAIRFRIHDQDPWAILQFEESSMMPGLLCYLSESLNTDLFALEQVPAVGYCHFSNLKSGLPQHIYTEHEEQEAEAINMDYIEILRHAAANNKFDAAKIDSLNEDETRREAFNVLAKVTPISFYNRDPWPEKMANDGCYRYLLDTRKRLDLQLGNGSDDWDVLAAAINPV